MALACLAKISPLNLATGTRVDIFVSNVNDPVNGRRVNGLDGKVWSPAIVEAPRLIMRLWNGDFISAAEPGTASLAINMNAVKLIWPNADAYAWTGAPITIYAEEAGAAWPWTPRFVGNVEAAPRPKGQVMTLDAKVDLRPFEADVLPNRYAGTTGAEGTADIKNRPKPLVIGWAQNVEPILIDPTNSVYQFSAYGAIEEVTNLYERGSDFGNPVGNHATYAALVAATIPPGRWATCLASGMIRLGAPAYGVITGDLKGHRVGSTTPRLPGAIISALATIAGVSAGLIEAASLSAMDAARAFPHNIVLTENATFLDVVRDIALGVNYQSGVSLTGKLFVARPVLSGTELIVFEAKGRRSPQVTDSEEATVSPPYVKTTLGSNRSWRVHSADEIAFMAPIVELGRYDPATTYREGNIVDSADQSRWIYTGTSPSAGNAPPAWPTTSNAWWANVTPPFDASGMTYADGTPFEELKPAEPGATNGAPPGSFVGGVPVEDVIAGLGGGLSLTINRPVVSLWAYENGIVVDYANARGQLKVWSGGVDVTAGATLSATATGCVGDINSAASLPYSGLPKGHYRVTSMSADDAKLVLTAVYDGKTLTAEFTLTKIRTGIQPVTSLPTNNLFPERTVSYQEKLWIYKGAPINGWRPMIDVDSALDGAKLDPRTVTYSKLVIANKNDIFPDPQFNDLEWWGIPTPNPNFGVQDQWDATQPNRFLTVVSPGGFDCFSSSVPVEANASYRVKLRIYLSPDFNGWFGPTIHMPLQAWFTPGPHITTPDIDGGNYPVIGSWMPEYPKGGWTEYTKIFKFMPNATGNFMQIRTRGQINTGYVQFAWEVVRATDADLIVDGVILARHVKAEELTGDRFRANTIDATRMNVTDLSALSANLGSIIVDNAHIGNLQVDTIKIANNAVSTGGIAEGSVSLSSTAAGNVCAITLTPLSTNTKWLVIVAGNGRVGNLAPSGTQLAVHCTRVTPVNGLRIDSKLFAGQAFTMANHISGLTGPTVLTMSAQASGGIGSGDPHTIDFGRIIVIQLEK